MSGDNPVGRPSVITPEIIRKLEEAFSVGASDLEACFIAGIGKTALYEYQKQNPDFTERKEALKSMTSYAARKVVNDKIIEGDADTAKWQLERKNKDEYGTKATVDSNVKGSLDIHGLLKEISGQSADLPSDKE